MVHPTPQAVRRVIIEQSRRAHVGHIGSCLSVVEILCAVYSGVLNARPENSAKRDRFVLSKGHAALAFYAVLHECGVLDADALETFCGGDSLLGVHPEIPAPGVDFCTGSLGHGLSYAVGSALAARMDGANWRALALLSDAECNEGSVWEAAAFAGHHRLGNVVAIVDANGQQALGATVDILDLEPLPARWEAFGWEAVEVDGHDMDALCRAMEPRETHAAPRVIIARTTFGRGVSYMEGQLDWHYLPMDEAQYRQALGEIGAS